MIEPRAASELQEAVGEEQDDQVSVGYSRRLRWS
jgi:hypothetical protein